MLQTSPSRIGLCFLGLIAVAIAGCQPTEEPSGTLTGTVKSRGEICNNCLISITNTETLFRRGGNVEDSGTFKLTGLPFGDYQVRIVQMPTNLVEKVFDERIPKKYRNLKTSGLMASVTSVEPVTLDIDME